MLNLDRAWLGLRIRHDAVVMRAVLVASVVAVGLAFVPLHPRGLHVFAVVVPTAAALVLAVLPSRWVSFLRIGVDGIDTRVGRRRSHLDPQDIARVELADRDSGVRFIVRDADDHVAQEVPLHHVGTPLTALLLARAAGLPASAPPYALARLRREEAAVLEAVMTGPPSGSGARSREVFTDPEVRGPVPEIALRALVGTLGLASVGLLATATGDGWGGRALVAAGVLLAITLLPALRRGRDIAVRNRWRLDDTTLDVVDRDRERCRLPLADIGAAVPLRGAVVTAGGRAVQGPVLLLVDRSTAPLAELPLRGHDVAPILRALRGRGVPTVDLDTLPAEEPDETAEPLVPEVPNGRFVLDGRGAHWLDADGNGFTLATATGVHLVEIVTIEGRPWARLHGVAAEDPHGASTRVLVTAPLRSLRITREDLRVAAHAAGYEVRDPEATAWAQAAQREMTFAASPAAASLGRRLPDGATVLKDRLLQRFTRGGRITIGVVAVCGLAVRLMVMADDGAPVGYVLAAAAIGVVLVIAMSARGERVVVSADRIEFRRRLGKVDWVVERAETGAVVTRRDKEFRRVAFYDSHGAVLRDVQFPGPGGRVDAALADWGWPLGRPMMAAPPAQI